MAFINKNIEEIYINFSISSFQKIEMTKLAQITQYSHDIFTKNLLLNDELDDDRKLWKSIKPFLRDYENEDSGSILIDDMLIHKPYTKVNDIVCWHYDHVSQRMAKGILMLNFHYSDDSGISIPLGYEIISKSEDKWSEKYQKYIKKSMFTKNEIMQDKLRILHYNNNLKYRYVLFDKWFASIKNLIFIEEELKKKFVCPIKSNRKIALTLEDRNNKNYANISSTDIEGGSSRLVYIEGYEKPLRLIKQVVKNGDDDESTYLYLVTNDIDLSFNKILEIYKRRWKIEEYHKSLKQNLKIEHSPTKVEISQRNHIHLSVCGFIKLEKLRLNYKMNHFAIKEKIYIEALRIAYAKVGEMMTE
jgi:hypothetical protein